MVLEDGATRKTQVKAVFDRLAEVYDATGPGCFAYFGKRLVEELIVEPGMRVLDVATGRGAVLFPAAERVGPLGAVEGIDISEEMIRATNAVAMQRGSVARVQIMDAEQLAFPDGAFDRVLCGFGLMFFPHQENALVEFRRVLRPGGRLGVSTWKVSQAHHLSVVLDEVRLGASDGPGWITDADHLVRLLEQAGFVDPQVIADSKVFRYSDVDEYWENARSTGLRRQLDGLDAEQTKRVRDALVERVAPHQHADGIYLEATALLAFASR